MSSRIRASRALAAAACCLAVLALAACGGSSSSGSSSSTTAASPSADPAVVKLVPSAIKSKGAINVATDPTYAPNEFIDTDGSTVIGMDVDLAHALAGVMGIKATIVKGTFDSLIPGLAAGKYDVGMASFTDTKEREKTVDFVTYLTAGTSFFTLADGGANVTTLADLCGHSVSVEKGTTQATDATAQDAKCRKAGKPGVKVEVFPGQDGANLALSSGRAQLSMADSPVAGYQVQKSSGKFKLVGKSYANAPYGIAIPKDSGLAQPMLAALKKLMSDGTYTKILTKWGVQSGAIANPQINGAIS
jgi:polar amino acid transport system substrate-binding protein